MEGNMKHSNVFYALCWGERDENGNRQIYFKPVESARSFTNPLGLDLVKFDGKISEGKTGMTLNPYHTKLDDFVKWANEFGVEKIQSLIDDAVEKYGISPRYTRPNEKRADVFTQAQ